MENEIEKELGNVLSRYAVATVYGLKRLGNAGGFSGAEFWRIEADEASFCLRCWPNESPTRDQLNWIHHVLQSAAINHCDFIPAPFKTRDGLLTYVQAGNRLWEITPWMPGKADFHLDPNEERLTDVMRKLAKFHQAAAQVTLGFGKSDGIGQRIEMLNAIPKSHAVISRARSSPPHPCFDNLYKSVMPIAVNAGSALFHRLKPFADTELALQPVIRDVWHDHILFAGNQVSGIVDFGAMKVDSIVLDLARLLGSLLGSPNENADAWGLAQEAYHSVRPLQESELDLIETVEAASQLLGALNWLRWVFVERRKFDDWEAVAQKVNQICQRLASPLV